MQLEPERLVKILEVLRELPAPNYRCVWIPRSQSPNHPHTALVSSASRPPSLRLTPGPDASFLQDPGVPHATSGAHGLIQCSDQHARPQPGHRVGPQPAEVGTTAGGIRAEPPEATPGMGVAVRGTGEGCGGLAHPREKQEVSEVHRVGWGSPTGHKAFVSSYTVLLSSGIGTGSVLAECLLSKHVTVSRRTGLRISACQADSEKS